MLLYIYKYKILKDCFFTFEKKKDLVKLVSDIEPLEPYYTLKVYVNDELKHEKKFKYDEIIYQNGYIQFSPLKAILNKI